MYASALASVRGDGSDRASRGRWMRAGGRLWRRVWSGNGQALYLIDADPSAGLALAPVSHWDVHGGSGAWRPGATAAQLSGPSATAWRTRSAGAVLHLRWLVDPVRPWAGVSPLQHARRYQQSLIGLARASG